MPVDTDMPVTDATTRSYGCTPHRSPRARRPGFSLIEVLVVISIVGLLIALLLPSLAMAKQQARRMACQSNLHQLGVGANVYLNDSDGSFWRYYHDDAAGRHWWFGFERDGPGGGKHRPLDLSRSVLGRYLSTESDAFQCPGFPYDDPGFFPKFDRRSASYGFNLALGPPSARAQPAQRDALLARPAPVFLFADGIHFDFNPEFNEGHYIQHTSNVAMPSGYAHFRHDGQAQVVMLDGQVSARPLYGDVHATVADGPAGNLTDADGSAAIYGQ